MKLNWGTGILIVIILFVTIMLSMVYFSFQQKVNLVTPDYYPKEIEYQQQIETLNRTNSLTEKPVISVVNKTITIKFPPFFSGKKNMGKIQVYRPSDSDLDHNFDLDLSSDLSQMVEIKDLIKGKYIVKLDWISDSVVYFMETDIYVN